MLSCEFVTHRNLTMCISLHVGVTSCMHQRLHECGELHSVAGVHYRNLLSGLSTGCKERQFGTRCTVVLVLNGWCKANSLGACCSGAAGRLCWHWHSRCQIRAPLTRLIRQCPHPGNPWPPPSRQPLATPIPANPGHPHPGNPWPPHPGHPGLP